MPPNHAVAPNHLKRVLTCVGTPTKMSPRRVTHPLRTRFLSQKSQLAHRAPEAVRMSESQVIANQMRILKNQKNIVANQSAIRANQETIKKNQAAILKNQSALATIITNQKQILAAIKS
jgi:hypothetical protein